LGSITSSGPIFGQIIEALRSIKISPIDFVIDSNSRDCQKKAIQICESVACKLISSGMELSEEFEKFALEKKFFTTKKNDYVNREVAEKFIEQALMSGNFKIDPDSKLYEAYGDHIDKVRSNIAKLESETHFRSVREGKVVDMIEENTYITAAVVTTTAEVRYVDPNQNYSELNTGILPSAPPLETTTAEVRYLDPISSSSGKNVKKQTTEKKPISKEEDATISPWLNSIDFPVAPNNAVVIPRASAVAENSHQKESGKQKKPIMRP